MIISDSLAKQLITDGRLVLGDYFICLSGEYYITSKKLTSIGKL